MSGGINTEEFEPKAKQGLNQNLLNASQISCLTQFSRNGTLNMDNRKPYRTKEQKKMAKASAVLCEDGTYRSTAPTSEHRNNKRKFVGE